MSNDELVELVRRRADSYLGGGVRDGRVLDAMRAVDRAAFLPLSSRPDAYRDESLPIGAGQTCSEPSMVAFMLDKLEPRPGSRVLEVGTGSGYAAAILSLLCSPGGAVITAEIVPELAAGAEAACRAALGSIPASRRGLGPSRGPEVLAADGSTGLPERGPYDRILLSAGVSRPSFREEPLLAQLAGEGILLYPEARGGLYRITRRGSLLVRDSWRGVAFVRLKGRNS